MRTFVAAAVVAAGAALTFGCNSSTTTPINPLPAFTHFYTASNASTPAPQIWQFALPLSNSSSPTVTMPGNGATNVKSIAFDRFGDMVAVNNQGTGNVYITAYAPFVTSASTPIATITTGFTCCAYVVAVDPGGLVWTCSTIGACYQYPGPYSGSVSPAPSITLSDLLVRPEGLAWNAAGDLFIANEGTGGNIIRFNHPVTNGETHSAVLNTGGETIIGLAMDGAGNLYAGSHSLGHLLRFNASNQANGATPDFVDTATGSTDIYSLAIDAAGNLYAADLQNGKILVFPTVATSFSNTLAPTVVLTPPSGNPEAAAIGP
ncbi:MAG TPA: hypothetical protein VN934_09255 [Candidatus Tumulicola sp.]|nr:hypothetical protein [Candidatus Tumulicola sp.]